MVSWGVWPCIATLWEFDPPVLLYPWILDASTTGLRSSTAPANNKLVMIRDQLLDLKTWSLATSLKNGHWLQSFEELNTKDCTDSIQTTSDRLPENSSDIFVDQQSQRLKKLQKRTFFSIKLSHLEIEDTRFRDLGKSRVERNVITRTTKHSLH